MCIPYFKPVLHVSYWHRGYSYHSPISITYNWIIEKLSKNLIRAAFGEKYISFDSFSRCSQDTTAKWLCSWSTSILTSIQTDPVLEVGSCSDCFTSLFLLKIEVSISSGWELLIHVDDFAHSSKASLVVSFVSVSLKSDRERTQQFLKSPTFYKTQMVWQGANSQVCSKTKFENVF